MSGTTDCKPRSDPVDAAEKPYFSRPSRHASLPSSIRPPRVTHRCERAARSSRIAGPMHFARLTGNDKIGAATDVIAHHSRQSGRHRLVDDEPPRLVAGARQHQTVSGGVHLAELALIHESERSETDAEPRGFAAYLVVRAVPTRRSPATASGPRAATARTASSGRLRVSSFPAKSTTKSWWAAPSRARAAARAGGSSAPLRRRQSNCCRRRAATRRSASTARRATAETVASVDRPTGTPNTTPTARAF